jgi:hypothetical protein
MPAPLTPSSPTTEAGRTLVAAIQELRQAVDDYRIFGTSRTAEQVQRLAVADSLLDAILSDLAAATQAHDESVRAAERERLLTAPEEPRKHRHEWAWAGVGTWDYCTEPGCVATRHGEGKCPVPSPKET